MSRLYQPLRQIGGFRKTCDTNTEYVCEFIINLNEETCKNQIFFFRSIAYFIFVPRIKREKTKKLFPENETKAQNNFHFPVENPRIQQLKTASFISFSCWIH